MVDRLKNKNGISYDKRPRIPSSSNVWSVDFSFFFFFFPSLSLTLVASTCWRRARGEGKDRPTRRAVHPILRRPDK